MDLVNDFSTLQVCVRALMYLLTTRTLTVYLGLVSDLSTLQVCVLGLMYFLRTN